MIDNLKSHFIDALKIGSIEESLDEKDDNAEKNRQKLSDKEEEVYKTLQDKYNQI